MDRFTNRKFSMNRNTGQPKQARRFSIGEPGVNGTYASHVYSSPLVY